MEARQPLFPAGVELVLNLSGPNVADEREGQVDLESPFQCRHSRIRLPQTSRVLVS